jgi:hypothetical protein
MGAVPPPWQHVGQPGAAGAAAAAVLHAHAAAAFEANPTRVLEPLLYFVSGMTQLGERGVLMTVATLARACLRLPGSRARVVHPCGLCPRPCLQSTWSWAA